MRVFTPATYVTVSLGVPVYLFNFHGYRTWMPDHQRGFTRRHEGVFAPDPRMADYYGRKAKFDRVTFDEARQRLFVETVREVCSRIDARCYYAVCIRTHAHAVIVWNDPRDWSVIYDRVKRIVGYKFAKTERIKGRRWLSARRFGTRVKDSQHLFHLMTRYLPNHRGFTYVDLKICARVDTRDLR